MEIVDKDWLTFRVIDYPEMPTFAHKKQYSKE